MMRWRGVAELLVDAVHHGSAAVEKVHQEVARKPFEILALVPPLAAPARRAGSIQSAIIASTYGTIRAVNHLVGAAAAVVATVVAARAEERAAGTPGKPAGAGGARDA